MSPRLRSSIALAFFIGLCLAVGALGSFFTEMSRESWYTRIAKPAWTPPDRVFGIVWTLLYVLMGIAAWLVWRTTGLARGITPLSLFAVQLALNLAWSAIFFGLRAPGAAFIQVLVLWSLVLATVIVFWRVRPLAGALLLPYLLWTTFAAALNLAIWRMN
ncbi:MAG TPA: TspO/MBR family protein [Longimicrobiales bacterium]